MKLAVAENVTKPEVPLRQDSSSKTDGKKNSRTPKTAQPPADRVTLSTPEAVLNSLNKEKAPSIPVSREEMAALFESFAESFRFSVKA